MWAAPLGVALLLASVGVPQRAGGLYDAEHQIESARLYGNIDYYSYYFVDVTVGTPPQRVSAILDTGSGLLAFPCAGCRHCGKHVDPLFDVSKSSSARWVTCGKDCRNVCRSGHCTYEQSYLEGSSISGYWFEDYVHLGDSIQHNPAVFARMGCHRNENGLFYTQKANGIFGILGAHTLLRTLFADKEHVNADVFSICLSTEGGRLTVGGHNQTNLRGPVHYVPQVGNVRGYEVQMSSIVVNGRSIDSFPETVIDSGTTYTYLNRYHYRLLRQYIEDYCAANDCGAARQGDCWQVTGARGLDGFPPLDVFFGTVRTVWRPSEYLYKKAKINRWCYSFMDDGPRTTATLGASWMLYKEIVFDIHGHRIGIAPADCPEYVRPLAQHFVHAESRSGGAAPDGLRPDEARPAPADGGPDTLLSDGLHPEARPGPTDGGGGRLANLADSLGLHSEAAESNPAAVAALAGFAGVALATVVACACLAVGFLGGAPQIFSRGSRELTPSLLASEHTDVPMQPLSRSDSAWEPCD